jgi:hypothetical protein
MLKDLVAANNSSPELQHYIDSINPSKIKFSTDILTVKNQDPVKTKEKAEAGVANMASRAASRPRLGESVSEGWNTGNNRVSLPDTPHTYWSGTGALQKEYDALYAELVPSQGKADTIEGEVLRASSKIVYRHYNDGDEFNEASFDQLEPYIGTVTGYDDLAHKAIEFAVKANGNYTPNPDWDSLDVMDYGPAEEDDYDDEDDYGDDGWPDDDEEEVDEGRGDSKGLHKKVTIVKGRDAGKTGYVRQIKTDKLRNRVYLDLDLEDGGQAVVLKQDVRLVKDLAEGYTGRETKDGVWRVFKDGQGGSVAGPFKSAEEANAWIKKQNQGVVEARTTWNNDFYVYDPKTLAVKKKFRTHKGAKQYAEANGLKVASAEYYHDSVSKEVDEGWESGPEERTRVERDPDAEYDARRQEKADDEMHAQQAKRPQSKVYTLSGRGPNQEPNYEFPGEYATQDEADKARARLMADPKTPNPRDIGIRSRTKYLDENSVTPLRDLEDYQAKKKALQDIQTDPDTAKDPELSLAVMRRLAGLEKQRSELK